MDSLSECSCVTPLNAKNQFLSTSSKRKRIPFWRNGTFCRDIKVILSQSLLHWFATRLSGCSFIAMQLSLAQGLLSIEDNLRLEWKSSGQRFSVESACSAYIGGTLIRVCTGAPSLDVAETIFFQGFLSQRVVKGIPHLLFEIFLLKF